MPLSATASFARPADDRRWLTVVGIGENGLDSLSGEARDAVAEADHLVGGDRHLRLIPAEAAPDAQRHAWPSPMLPFLETIAGWRGQRVVVLASGDPLLHGVASNLIGRIGRDDITVLPAVSSFQLACAAMLWPVAKTLLVTACGRPIETLSLELYDAARIILFSADEATPAAAAKLLVAQGFGESRLTVLERLGSSAATASSFKAIEFGSRRFDALNVVAIEAVAGPDTAVLSRAPGLPDDAFAHDGQITRREIRAITLARLSPTPGALLWDIGAGSGSIGIEWMRAAPGAKAIAIEQNAERAARARQNARELGVPGLDLRDGKAPEALDGLPSPDAIFIGGGATVAGVIEASWQALKPGGRLVANAVTIETEMRLIEARRSFGGDLVRLQASYADEVGRMTGWRPAMAVTQFAATKLR